MSAQYVRERYGVDYKRDERVIVDGRAGIIVSFPDSYLGVRFDGEKRTSRCHPTWRVEREGPTAREVAVATRTANLSDAELLKVMVDRGLLSEEEMFCDACFEGTFHEWCGQGTSTRRTRLVTAWTVNP